MAQELFECVPNVSEGRDRAKIEYIAETVRIVPGVRLLDVDASIDANRTVFTFVGDRTAIVDGAFALMRAVAEVCDMRAHRGAHPRLGAVDVCPFVALQNATIEDAIDLAQRLGARIWREFAVPVYLYGAAANRPERVRLEEIRRGEYEGLKEKLYRIEWEPDIGDAIFNEKLGAIVIGARKLLIAFNVNVKTSDVLVARTIAARLRESGGSEKHLKSVKAIGWFLPHLNRAQISMNLTDFEISGLHDAYEACKHLAAELGTEVTGSEIVGLVPRAALVQAGMFYAKQRAQNTSLSNSLGADQYMQLAIEQLNLEEIRSFRPEERVLEELLAGP